MPLIKSILHGAAQLSTFMSMYIWDFVKTKMGATNKRMLVEHNLHDIPSKTYNSSNTGLYVMPLAIIETFFGVKIY